VLDFQGVRRYFYFMATLITIEEATRETGLSERQLYRYINSGRVKVHKEKYGQKVVKESLRPLIAKRKVKEVKEECQVENPYYLPGANITLDGILENMTRAAFTLSQCVVETAQTVKPGDYDLPAITASMQKTVDSIGKLIEYAPFLAVKQKLEGVGHLRQWLDKQPLAGRQQAENLLSQYEREILREHGMNVDEPAPRPQSLYVN
jgi:hypothetical protein